MENIKKIIKEEINDFDWASSVESIEPAMEFLLDNFGDLKRVIKGNKTYYVDSEQKPLFMYHRDGENGYVYVDYYKIWSILYKDFDLTTTEITELIKKWLDVSYDLVGLTPRRDELHLN
tara:strand:+ start:3261 stop:3617 length:357 start_codon:yes stop_codon:yes gene_type:complete